MKKSMLILVLLASTIITKAQSEKFTAAMKKQLVALDSAKTTAQSIAVANSFERIGDAEKTQWLPYYYAAFALSNVGWMDPAVNKDENAAKILALCDKADAIQKTADICTMRNMAATQQMMVDPQSRYMKYGVEAAMHLQKAIGIDATNPRIYYLQGMSTFGTPEAFGGGKAKAKPLFEKAAELFKSTVVKPLHPSWGEKQNAEKLAECQ